MKEMIKKLYVISIFLTLSFGFITEDIIEINGVKYKRVVEEIEKETNEVSFYEKNKKISNRFQQDLKLSSDLFRIWVGTEKTYEKQEFKVTQFIPGLPTATPPSLESSYIESYLINIHIDNSYNTDELKNEMKKIIGDVWPELTNCNDCIQFKVIGFGK
jgi:hypothetical protein